MNESNGRGEREMPNCIQVSDEEYNFPGVFTAGTTIHIETCGSDRGSSRRSSKKSASTTRRQRRKRQQQLPHEFLWFTNMEDDSLSAPTGRHGQSSGKARPASLKTPFAAGRGGAPYNKKLRKKNMQRHQQQQQPCSFLFDIQPTPTAESETISDFYISPAHQAVAESSAPWNPVSVSQGNSDGFHFKFLGHGGITESSNLQPPPSDQVPRDNKSNHRRHKARTKKSNSRRGLNNYSDDDSPFTSSSDELSVAVVCGGSRPLAPMPAPSLLPPLELLPASSMDVCFETLEQCFAEVQLDCDELL
ncbi:hypothetical protein DPX39_020014300 [Trypanosoma brucei equiperdum]|uniref:Uncharacterized protein n=1 Tax=Trypanosoma brucei equiperdum TaxID=630700 RepID=A0A3L6LBV2_9TRYP|nr:hypothetical protein DPX39_020014300 [Trypanosoma brucei equiperdum]